ncbi:MAG: 16S rRNA (uracil(1498)-N(3))-methyltransferase [Bdellovibrionaceae bacterium]|nr:16S rRNA (uracil(1498)-N(3))-methyltransferase [Pseudobdellovibrionaceae bacterium]
MRRYWIEKKDLNNDIVQFSGETFHHIFEVCRQHVGSKFEVLTEDSKAHFVEVLSVTKKSAQAVVLEIRKIPPLPEPHFHLALAVSRFPVMDSIVEKAVELGVQSIQPLFTDFSFVRTQTSLPPNKTERWGKIVKSATQQSGRGDIMAIAPALSLDCFLSKFNPSEQSLVLFAYEGGSTLSVKSYLQQKRQKSPGPLKDIWIFVGSEGGFSQHEVKKMQDLDFYPVTLGAQVLRVETACMALVSVLKYEFDLMC